MNNNNNNHNLETVIEEEYLQSEDLDISQTATIDIISNTKQ